MHYRPLGRRRRCGRALAGIKGYVTNLAACPDGTPVTPEFVIGFYHRLMITPDSRRDRVLHIAGSAVSDVRQALLDGLGQRVPGRQDQLTAPGGVTEQGFRVFCQARGVVQVGQVCPAG